MCDIVSVQTRAGGRSIRLTLKLLSVSTPLPIPYGKVAQSQPFFLRPFRCSVTILDSPGMASLTLPIMALMTSVSGTLLSRSFSRAVASCALASRSAACEQLTCQEVPSCPHQIHTTCIPKAHLPEYRI